MGFGSRGICLVFFEQSQRLSFPSHNSFPAEEPGALRYKCYFPRINT